MTRLHKPLATTALAALLLLLPATAVQAAAFSLSGQLAAHNQVLQFDITLSAAGRSSGTPALWSDSWRSGLNFDPIAALWAPQGNAFGLLAEVDDDDSVAPGQGFYDTGMRLAGLADGRYRLTLGAAPNTARANLLALGFVLDGEAPIALADWTQPSFDPNANDQKASFWRLQFSGVEQVSAVPETGSAWLLLLGAPSLLVWQRRRRVVATMPACTAASSTAMP